jgi:hypothetical protein
MKNISAYIKINQLSTQNCSTQCGIKLLYLCIHHILVGMCNVSLVVTDVQFLMFSDCLLKEALSLYAACFQ